jgi:hypothetical protein
MSRNKQNAKQDRAFELAQQRFKDRLLAYLESIKDNEQMIQVGDCA